MKLKISVYIFAITILVTGCVAGVAYGQHRNPMLDPQIDILQRAGIDAEIQIWRKDGCKSSGFNEIFSIAKKLKNISLRYVSVMSQFGKYSDVEIDMAADALVASSNAQIGLLKDVAKKAEEMKCKSIERKAYNEIIASPVFDTGIARVFHQDLVISQSKLHQLGPK